MTTVVLADDHQLLRHALKRALEDQGHTVLAEAADGEEAVRLVLEHRPDVVVMDVTMPVLDGLEATRRLIEADPALRILVLTMHGEPEVVTEALDVGAMAFLTKDASMQEVVQTVEDLATGQVLLSAELAERMLGEFSTTTPPITPALGSGEPTPAPSPLTKREEEILQLIADGASTTAVGEQLFISVKTVKNHLASIYEKLDARDRTQAVVSGVRLGIIVLR